MKLSIYYIVIFIMMAAMLFGAKSAKKHDCKLLEYFCHLINFLIILLMV